MVAFWLWESYSFDSPLPPSSGWNGVSLISEMLWLATVALGAVEPRAVPPDITLAYSGSSPNVSSPAGDS